MKKICVLVIYNHNYEKNIEKVREILGKSFSHVYQIMPFYQGTEPDIISVYENSYRFSGYITQALAKIPNVDSYTHFLVTADDIILHPDLNDDNIIEKLELDDETAYITSADMMNDKRIYTWSRCAYSYYNMLRLAPSCEPWKHLPSTEQARELCRLHGFDWEQGVHETPFAAYCMNTDAGDVIGGMIKPRSRKPCLRSAAVIFCSVISTLVQDFLKRFGKKSRSWGDPVRYWSQFFVPKKSNDALMYPLLGGYSDLCIIPAGAMQKFAHYCGVMAAMNIFVELAIPTALHFACPKVKREKDIAYKSVILWGGAREELRSSCHASLQELERNWPDDVFFYHPIKLSQWK